ncbi:LCP family protein [Streptomyces sp. I05A-00742]|uniref:LCP family protein n=1 Tax=Streptomyces sp. I05A-00742 TaxID=2732853 RepID=UPI00289DB914|nr:LCP family protein [Streptomyces sp. I05A-00742]
MLAPARPRRPRRARHGAPHRPRWGLRIATALALAILVAGGAGHAVVHGIDRGIGRVDPFTGLSHRPRTGHGTTVLLVGTDSRDAITEDERTRYHLGGEPCHCTDTMMLVHLSEGRDRVTVVSLPRDTYTVLPEHPDASGALRPAHPQKLNAAYAEGGPGLTVRAVEQLTGVHVDHYLEVDFAGFMRTVDLVGGVRVCTEEPLRDDHSGLDLPAGSSTLGGGQALQYVRSRHVDASADLGRMRRQQRFVAALLQRTTSSGVLFDPSAFRRVVAALLGSVRADRGFGGAELVELGRAVRGLTPAASEFASVPIAAVDFPVPGLGSTVKWDENAAAPLFQALREDRPLALRSPRRAGDGNKDEDGDGKAPAAATPGDAVGAAGSAGRPDGAPAVPSTPAQPAPPPVEVAPDQVHVQVLNGSGRPGLGRDADTALHATGFATTGLPADIPPPTALRTVIGFDPRWDRSARSLAAALPGARLRAVPGQGPLMQVTLGTDFAGVRPVRPARPTGPAVPSGRPETGAGGGASGEVITGDRAVCDE